MSTRISIIVPVFNVADYMKACLDSILDQKYENLQLIVVDGGSTDGTLEIIKDYESRLSYWVSEYDEGQAHAINKGLAVADGDIVNWINGDDLMEPGSLERLNRAYTLNSEANIFCGVLRIVDESNEHVQKEYIQFVGKTVDQSIWNTKMAQPSTFYRLEVVRKLGGINQSLHYVFDLELYYRYLVACGVENIVEIPFPIARFRLRIDAKTAVAAPQFKAEKNSIQLFFARECQVPDFVIDRIEKESLSRNYIPQCWNIRFLNRSELLNVMGNRYAASAMKEKQFGEALFYIRTMGKLRRNWLKQGFYELLLRFVVRRIKALYS